MATATTRARARSSSPRACWKCRTSKGTPKAMAAARWSMLASAQDECPLGLPVGSMKCAALGEMSESGAIEAMSALMA